MATVLNETPQLYCLLLIPLAVIIWQHRRASYNAVPLPPGPRPLPIIGNLFDVPSKPDTMAEAYRDLNAKYGDLVYLNALGRPIVVLGTLTAAMELLEKRSANYSDRPFSAMGTLTGWTWVLTINPYGPQWRRTRRLFHEYMHPNAIVNYRPVQQLYVHRYLRRLLDCPEDFLHHGRRLFGSTIIRIGYGLDVDHSDVDYLGLAEAALRNFSETFLPGRFLVETFPILLYLPSFFPGARFKRWAAKCYPTVRKMRDIPWAAAVDLAYGLFYDQNKNLSPPSMTTALLDRISEQGDPDAAAEEEEYSKNAVASAYAGGADTTLSTLQTFYIAMASYPDIQTRAQEELDTVVGPHRLPTFDDATNLPYVAAIIMECLRWKPVVPLSVVHLSVAEDEYRGYRIPAGTTVVNSPWAYTRDPKLYPDPETFNPDRFLKQGKLDLEVTDPRTIIFGFGRRICPGRHFAEAALFMTISSVLHTFSITAPLDDTGSPVNLMETVKMTHGVLSYPEPYECVIKPRSAEAVALIHASSFEDEEV